ncbi:MAG: extensin family protein [Arachnia sp.]
MVLRGRRADASPVGRVSRRAVLWGPVSALTGCSLPSSLPLPDRGSDAGSCRSPESLESFTTLAGAPLISETSGAPARLRADPRFIPLLEAWAADWAELSGLGPITGVRNYGAFVDKCDSWHAAGRAFDIAAIEHEQGSVSCRVDQWGPGTAEQLRGYWRLAASTHLHFAYVLTSLFDDAHRNHIHIDNGVSGFEGPVTFNEGSRVQVQVVQATLRHVFGVTLDYTGSYDAQTRDALRGIQADLGITAPLREPEGWSAYLRAAAGRTG